MIWILFALSLDLVLGYAGIVTLGHVGVLRLRRLCGRHILDPRHRRSRSSAILLRSCVAALLGLVTGALILHTTGVTFLMLTLAIVLDHLRIRQSGAHG